MIVSFFEEVSGKIDLKKKVKNEKYKILVEDSGIIP